MGVITSFPEPIRLQLNDISRNSSESIVIDSNLYNGNITWVSKACEMIANNKKVKKIVFKLHITDRKSKKLGSAFAKSIRNRESVVIYGSGLMFFEEDKWVDIWTKSNIEVRSN